MKLMGAPTFFAAAADLPPAAQAACAALYAELKNGQWSCAGEVGRSYPHARWFNDRAFISIDDGFDAVIAFNFERGIAMINSAAPNALSSSAAPDAQRRSA